MRPSCQLRWGRDDAASREPELELDLDAPEGSAIRVVSEHSLGWGVASRQILGGLRSEALTAVQLIPTALAATVAGVLLGTALPWLLGPALDLTAFTDGYDPPVHTDLRLTLLLGLALLATVASAAGVEALASRRRRLGGVLRLGGE
jgi:hypothetical protein